MANYYIESTQSTIYLDKAGRAVNGYLVYVYLKDYDEVHEMRVKSLSADVVVEAAEALVEQRDAIAEL